MSTANEGMSRQVNHRFDYQTDDPSVVSLIESFRWSPAKFATFLLLSLVSFGIFPLFIFLFHGGYSAFIRKTHERCQLDGATVFLAETPFTKGGRRLIGLSVLAVGNNNNLPASGISLNRGFKLLKPVNRQLLSSWRKIFSSFSGDGSTREFIRDDDSASAFKVHIEQPVDSMGDCLQAGVNFSGCGTFFWNTDRQIFQRFEVPPPYFCGIASSNVDEGSQEHLRIPSPQVSWSRFVVDESLKQQEGFVMASIMDVNLFQQELTANDAKFIVELYRNCWWKTSLYWISSVITGGLLHAICTWKPNWRLTLTCNKLDFANSRIATHVKIEDTTATDNIWIRPLWLSSRRGVLLHDESEDATISGDNATQSVPWHLVWRFFVFESVPFILDTKCNRFVVGPSLLEDLIADAPAETYRHPWARRVLCGLNVMPVPVTPLWLVYWREAFTPLYVFQIGCCITWLIIEYIIYASLLLTFAFLTITWSVFMTYTNERAVWRAVVGRQEEDQSEESSQVTIAEQDGATDYVHHPSTTTNVDPKHLLPGDIVYFDQKPDGSLPTIPADVVLIKGSCLVDESMLSGEVTPVNKFASSNYWYHQAKRHEKPLERNILHSGTNLLRLTPGTVGVVSAIGFATTRGRLVRAVLRPSKADLRFTVETMRFLGALALVGVIGLAYTIAIRALRREEAQIIVVMCIILISVIIPPQISIGLSISLVIAQVRLKAKQIFCTNPKSITPTGSVDLICFDKTGTLTEESVRLRNVLAIESEDGLPKFIEAKQIDASGPSPLSYDLCSACCNSVTLLPQSLHSEANSSTSPVGDPIDLELLNSSSFCLVSSGLYFSSNKPGLKIQLVKNFGFSPERRSACVVAKVSNVDEESLHVFVKGAPDQIHSKCLPTTIPQNIDQIVEDATQKGLRLISLASKRIGTEIDIENVDQDELETGLQLDGVAFFENSVKPESKPTIAQLHQAKLRTLIITGDDVRTAISTARECGIFGQNDEVVTVHEEIELAKHKGAISTKSFIQLCAANEATFKSIAVTESAWQVLRLESQHHPNEESIAFKVLLERCSVFARFRPDQKAEVVEEFQTRFGFIVAMVGDGANDCCALKAADVGVALTEAEASVASAFTCKRRNVSPVVDILKEGRCSLTSTFGLFGVLVSYSFVQFTSMCIMYWFHANFTDISFMYIDLFLLTTISLAFPLVPAFHHAISVERPPRRLLCFAQVAPIVLHNAINVAFQVFIYHYVQQQPWFLPYNVPQSTNLMSREYSSFEVFAIYSISIFQYVWSCFVFSRGAPFRSVFGKSRVFTTHLALLFVINHFIVIYLPEPILQTLKLLPPPSYEFRIVLVLIAYVNFSCCYLAVRLVGAIPIDSLLSKLKSLPIKLPKIITAH